MIKYRLIKHPFAKNRTGYVARIVNQKIVNQDSIIEQITREGSILKSTECRAVLDAFFNQIVENANSGVGYHGKYIDVRHTIKGNFIDEGDSYNSDRHSINVTIGLSKEFTNKVKDPKTEKLQYVEHLPVINRVYDHISDETDSIITSGGVIDIIGENIKIYDSNPLHGVYIIGDDNKIVSKVERISVNFPQKLMVVLPRNIQIGSYYIEILTSYRDTKITHTCRFNKKLTVV
ncbi:MAG: DUF4469 domain-containing protein [Bacteroidales bacterium]|jgi:hypothetical protein|nr:DUF4469 domain-containing protein [Bacteroidales bacterium]